MKKFQKLLATSGMAVVAVAMVATPLPSVAQSKGSAPVSITDPLPLPTRDADNPLRNPFQTELCTGICSGRTSAFTTPSRPLVIEYISAWCTVSFGTSLTGLFIQTTAGGSQVQHVAGIPHFTAQSTSSEVNVLNISQLVRIYAAPSSTVSMRADAIGGSSYRCDINLSGHTTGP
jgi:hypothetical protein